VTEVSRVAQILVGEDPDFNAIPQRRGTIAGHWYSKIELAAFVVATSQTDLDRDEVLHLTEAMVAAGRRLDWRETPVVAPHRRHPRQSHVDAVVPIVAAHGMLIPKTWSRAITSCTQQTARVSGDAAA
jgi:thymidine phosphorylase